VLGRRALPYLAPLACSAALGAVAVRGVLAKAGRPALPLDDSFIHFVYAKSFAEGAPFRFGLAEGASTGATSLLWPLLLAPFHAVGLHGLSLVWAAWLLGTLFHAATVLETYRLAEPLTGRAVALGAAAMSLFYGAFAWFAWSGMETIAFAWAMVRAIRVASEWAERDRESRDLRASLWVAAQAALPALFRPEGAAITALVMLVLLVRPAESELGPVRMRAVTKRAPVLVALFGAALPTLLNLGLTGQLRSTTATVKWALGNPYYPLERFFEYFTGTSRMLVTELLAGGQYTAVFLPLHAELVLAAGVVAVVACGLEQKRLARALLVLGLALATFATCTFLTILWNRVRYIHPFATGWFVLAAAVAAQIGAVLRRLRPDAEPLGPIVAGVFAGLLASKLPWALDDLATSARAIDKQQVTLGVQARLELPADAVLGVNDTGAIAYFSERRTFDVVGLTTQSEARYWVAGAGSRYEHYETLPPSTRPTHFIVYPEWLAMHVVLGERLFSATVHDQTILGGATKSAHVADWSVLGRGALPRGSAAGRPVVAELDVADLESEAQHGFVLGPAFDTQNVVAVTVDDDGQDVADGERRGRTRDSFVVELPRHDSLRLVARLSAEVATVLEVRIDGRSVGRLRLPESDWSELELALPAGLEAGKKHVEVVQIGDGATFGSMHYWFVEG
jgi:hypothetical protein